MVLLTPERAGTWLARQVSGPEMLQGKPILPVQAWSTAALDQVGECLSHHTTPHLVCSYLQSSQRPRDPGLHPRVLPYPSQLPITSSHRAS